MCTRARVGVFGGITETPGSLCFAAHQYRHAWLCNLSLHTRDGGADGDMVQPACTMQPPWRLTIVSHLFRRFLAAYNSRIVSSNATGGVTTFEVGDPRFVLEKKESSVVSIVFVADALANTYRVSSSSVQRICYILLNWHWSWHHSCRLSRKDDIPCGCYCCYTGRKHML